jgi:hypothetical protein
VNRSPVNFVKVLYFQVDTYRMAIVTRADTYRPGTDTYLRAPGRAPGRIFFVSRFRFSRSASTLHRAERTRHLGNLRPAS